ncbi:MAG TPA: NAD(P)/FAD-dependent oxidoreductase [Candidatus Baltobacteraceae bacterium]|jgi:phytoene dehydrogenase-like protein|nr:NAD(P)/FAD-dependent oxidoreductase [Candidatus Baltobacteraceae bacterium]
MLDVAVVGGGHNGLACAALLAQAGLQVAVYERSDVLGGAAVSEPVWPGYTVSTASYVCTLLDPELVRVLDLPRHGYSAYRKDPATFNVLPDGRSLLLGSDEAANAREISRFDRDDVRGFNELNRVICDLGSRLFETFDDQSPHFANLGEQVCEVLQGSAAQLVQRYVNTPVLQAAVATDGIIGTNAGPRDPGTAYVLAHHYAGRALGVQGAWGYVRGGMGAISTALASAARAHGAAIHTASAVERICIENGAASGIVLRNGDEINARAVVSNAHPRTTFMDLAGKRHLSETFVGKIQSWKTTGVAFKLNLALGQLPNFRCRPGTRPDAHHRATIHIAPSIEYLQQAFEDTRDGGISKQPMLECFLQTPTDATLAPPGKHILSVFAQYYPYNHTDGWSSAQCEAVADRIVYMLSQFAPNIPGAIEARQILSPPDLEKRFGLIGGHIFHGELLPGQIYEHRFATRTPIRQLYLCGSGAHPGGCVSGFPGKRAAAAILADVRQMQAPA